MKKLSRLIVSLLLLAGAALPSLAQNWTDYLNGGPQHNVWFWLKRYGAWQDGRELNTFYPSQQAGNSFESMSLSKKSFGYQLIWMGTSDGTFYYRVRPEGNVLYYLGKTTKSNPTASDFTKCSGWIQILSADRSMVFTVDSNGTYRYFQATLVTN